jgi:RNA polymerase sigma factor (sigma-70 family)
MSVTAIPLDVAERNALVVAHRRLVPFVLKRLGLTVHPHADDLVAEGYLGLMRAVDLFQPERGVKFSTLACVAIRRRMTRFLARLGRVPTVPFPRHKDGLQFDPADHQYAEDLARQERSEAVCQALQAALARLPARWAAILRSRFHEGLTLREVAAGLGVCAQRVSSLERRALAYLRAEAPELADLLAA